MSTPAIIEAYKRQVAEGATWMAPYYLSSLKKIAILRGGIDYNTIDRFVQEEYGDGKYATEDVVCSYSYFGLNFDDLGITDEHILESFYSHRGSAGQETEARRELWRIGDFRQSERIKAAAEECMLSQPSRVRIWTPCFLFSRF
jgi:ubiquitin carboxyl-terminal hydrolase 25/28